MHVHIEISNKYLKENSVHNLPIHKLSIFHSSINRLVVYGAVGFLRLLEDYTNGRTSQFRFQIAGILC